MQEILILEDHTIVSVGLEMIIKDNFTDILVHRASTMDKAVQIVSKIKLSLLIMDIQVSGGGNSGMIKTLRDEQDAVPILVYSGRDEKNHAIPFIKAGADGFLSKNSNESDILLAIKTVITGKKYFSSEFWEFILNNFSNKKMLDSNPEENLTKREIEVMELLLQGKWTKEIAEELSLKVSTVSTHKQNIFQKMRVDNVIDLFRKKRDQN